MSDKCESGAAPVAVGVHHENTIMHLQARILELEATLTAARDVWRERVAELEAETAAFRQAIQTVREQYPEDVFPPGGTSTDSRGAGMARLTCDNILRAAEAAREEMGDAD